MSVKTTLEEILATILVAGEQLEPVYIHNPKSQTFATILTPDINALFAQLVSNGSMAATTAPATPSA